MPIPTKKKVVVPPTPQDAAAMVIQKFCRYRFGMRTTHRLVCNLVDKIKLTPEHVKSISFESLVVMLREKPDFIQVNYSLADRGVEERLLPAARDSGVAVLINLPFGRGKLFGAVRGRELPAWATEFYAASWGQFFLKYVLANAAVTCVIPGTDKPAYMIDNLQAGRGRLPDVALRKKMVEFYAALT